MRICIAGFCLVLAVLAPLAADVIVRGSLTHEYEAAPGDSISGTVILQNTGSEPQEVKLYQTDYATNAAGQIYYHDPATVPRSNASWIALSPLRLTVPPGGTSTSYYTLKVPSDPSLAGTYWSMLMVEPILPSSPESAQFKPGEVGVGITSVLRYGIRMILHIGQSGSVLPEIIGAELTSDGEKRFLQIDIENKGTRLLRVKVWSELYAEGGAFAGKFDGGHLAVFPGSSMRFKVDLTNAPRNTYNALVVMDCGNNNVFGTNYTILLE